MLYDVHIFCEISGSHSGEFEDIYFWEVAPRSLLEVDRRFRGAYCLHHQGRESSLFITLMVEALRNSETSVYSKETTQRYISEGSNFHTHFV
jgi:hypothetical protein